MKLTTFKCNPLAPRAIMAYSDHVIANPNGMPLFNGKSKRKVYGNYVIYETKAYIIVDELR